MTIDELGEEIRTLAAHIHAATARWLALIGEFDARGGDGASGAKSNAHWLAYMCGLSIRTARDHIRVARRLRELPLIAASFERGELSYSKVRALTRLENIEDEERMLTVALAASGSQLDHIVKTYQGCVSRVMNQQKNFEQRSLRWQWDDDGSLVLRARLPAEDGALLVKALEAARDAIGPPPPEIATAKPTTPHDVSRIENRNADALLALAEASLDDSSSTADRYQVVVHVEADALPTATSDDGATRCELDAGPSLPSELARRLACDASIVRIVERDGKPLSVGRKTRSIPPALRRALHSRDGGAACSFPGCTTTRHVDAHHIEHWADGGKTKLSNLVQLCRFHHRLLHEGDFSIRAEGSAFKFFSPDGRHLPHAPRPPRGDCATVTTANERRGLDVSPKTCKARDGGRYDLGLMIEAMWEMAPPPPEQQE